MDPHIGPTSQSQSQSQQHSALGMSLLNTLYTPSQLAAVFVVFMVCVLQLQLDKSVLSLAVVLCVVGVAYVAMSPPSPSSVVRVATGGPGPVLFNSDATLTRALELLGEYDEFDPDAHAEVLNLLQRFYSSYGALLMMATGTVGDVAAREYDRMWDTRRDALNTLYSFFIKSPDIPQDFHAVVRTIAAATQRCMTVLTRKHPRLRQQQERLHLTPSRPPSLRHMQRHSLHSAAFELV